MSSDRLNWSKSTTQFSPCRCYRYVLTRTWDESKPPAAFIGLNPSTADETQDDTTVRRCINFAKAWGCGGLVMLNIFAFRATDPKVMKAHPSPIGDDNNRWLRKASREASIVVAAWGVHGSFMDRGSEVAAQFEAGRLQCLGVTMSGHPKHPLYLPSAAKLIPYPPVKGG